MTVAELETRVAELEQKVAELREQLEKTRIAARIRPGLDQADRGMMVPAREALEALRKKYNIPVQ
jgi:predicted transcriptional regulator